VSWRTLRAALIGAWCLWAVLAWWAAPRRAEVDQALADIAADRVTVYQWADSWERPTAAWWGSSSTPRSWGRAGPLLVWRTDQGRTFYAVADAVSAGPVFTADGSEPLRAQTESIRAAVMASLSKTARPLHGDIRPDSRHLALLIGLVCVAVIGVGPAPAVGTRWYWFWLTTGVPLGLGVLAWLIAERPWPGRAGSAPEPGVDTRHRGLRGLLIAVAASIAAGVLGILLREIFGAWAIPGPPD
jgi:hypothetical protein